MTWRDRVRLNPFGFAAALAAIVLGALGSVLGDQVSAGMRNSLQDTANLVSHLWGLMFATGGILKIVGLLVGRTTIEIPGLWMMCGGYAFYSVLVLVGLGPGGMAAATIAAAMSLGSLIKAHEITRQARAVASIQRPLNNAQEDPGERG